MPGPRSAKDPATVGDRERRRERLRVDADRPGAAAALELGEGLRSSVTPETPSRPLIWSATSGENGWPTTLETMNCEVSDLPMAASVLAEAEAAEDRHHRHQRQADHQGARRGARASWVAQGVLGGQPADHPEEAAVDDAEQVEHGLTQEGAHDVDADEDEQDAAADAGSGPRCPRRARPTAMTPAPSTHQDRADQDAPAQWSTRAGRRRRAAPPSGRSATRAAPAAGAATAVTTTPMT